MAPFLYLLCGFPRLHLLIVLYKITLLFTTNIKVLFGNPQLRIQIFAYLNENGRLRRTYCIMVLDDRSRLITGGRFFYQDNSFNFQKVLKDAVATYGIPQKLYVDNCSPYKNVQLSLICGQLGCVLIHTPVRDGASKGKAERNFRTLRSRSLNALDSSRITGIDELNSPLADYIRQHISLQTLAGWPYEKTGAMARRAVHRPQTPYKAPYAPF